MEREVHALNAVVDRPVRPLIAILGGAKLGDEIGMVRRFLDVADVVCIGGGICFPFLAAKGHRAGQSSCPPEDVELARSALLTASRSRRRLKLPRDLVIARRERNRARTQSLDGVDVPDGWGGFDIGAKTATSYAAEAATASTVFWSGPMGRFEPALFAAGTHAIAQAVASTAATTVVGGGETMQAL